VESCGEWGTEAGQDLGRQVVGRRMGECDSGHPESVATETVTAPAAEPVAKIARSTLPAASVLTLMVLGPLTELNARWRW